MITFKKKRNKPQMIGVPVEVCEEAQTASENDYDANSSEINFAMNQSSKNGKGLLKFIEKDVIGRKEVFRGPFGHRKLLYCDYVASGKALKCIEQFMLKHVIPFYGNTHTTTTATSSKTTSFRKEAKEIVRRALDANDDDVVIFAGSGVTGAIHKLISVMDFSKPPIVFCGPFEHHSNLLPWREMNSYVVNIGETAEGRMNLVHLEIALQRWTNSGRPLIGSFSAASNITGIMTDTREVSALLHKYGAISLWDYATGAPYMDIDMHPERVRGYDASKDAVFISMHKFVGSPDAPGLLVASNKLFRNKVPSNCGGGTVVFVFENDHRYLKDIESREEGGTPAIIGSIRAGLALKLKLSVGSDVIMQREDEIYKRAMATWKDVPELEILGFLRTNPKTTEHKLAVFSFLVRHLETGYYLHCNYIVALLNDLFGIQSRGGCACAGVYAQRLLGIDQVAARRFDAALVEDPKNARIPNRFESERTENEILRPGSARLNFAYFLSDEDVDFIISAVVMVVRQGWKLLPYYNFNHRTGEWRHKDSPEELELKQMEDLTFDEDGMHFPVDTHLQQKHGLPTSRIDCLRRAEQVFRNATEGIKHIVVNESSKFTGAKVRDLRWFLLPSEALAVMKGKKVQKKTKLIFNVRREIKQKTEEELRKELFGKEHNNNAHLSNMDIFNEPQRIETNEDSKKKNEKKFVHTCLRLFHSDIKRE